MYNYSGPLSRNSRKIFYDCRKSVAFSDVIYRRGMKLYEYGPLKPAR